MNGDLFCVHYNKFGSSDTHESELGRFDTWQKAKAERNRIYMTFSEHIRAVWIMRINPGLDLQPERYGEVMRRRRPTFDKVVKQA